MRAATLALALLLATSGAAAAEILSCSLVPGWEQSGPTRTYEADNLFEYMDGNAEGYLIYGFVSMHGVTCKSGDDSVLIDISEMTDADAAYGIFASNRDPNKPVAVIGMGGQITPRRATFAKGKFYVELAANPDKDHTPALQAFVAELEKRIEGRSTPPEALGWFPSDGLVSARLIPESVLGLRALKRGYVAQYGDSKAFIVTEESSESASAVLQKLRARFADATDAKVADEAFQAKDQYLGGLCVFRKGEYVGGYANAPDPTDAATRAATLAARLP
jgi:hypothetical protein